MAKYKKHKKNKKEVLKPSGSKPKYQRSIPERQIILLKKISDGIRSGKTMKEVMLECGYSESYSNAPSQLRDTDTWKRLVGEKLPDEKILKVLNFLLDHKEWRAKDAGLDKALRIKRKYAPTDIAINPSRSLEEIDEEIARPLSEAAELISGRN